MVSEVCIVCCLNSFSLPSIITVCCAGAYSPSFLHLSDARDIRWSLKIILGCGLMNTLRKVSLMEISVLEMTEYICFDCLWLFPTSINFFHFLVFPSIRDPKAELPLVSCFLSKQHNFLMFPGRKPLIYLLGSGLRKGSTAGERSSGSWASFILHAVQICLPC